MKKTTPVRVADESIGPTIVENLLIDVVQFVSVLFFLRAISMQCAVPRLCVIDDELARRIVQAQRIALSLVLVLADCANATNFAFLLRLPRRDLD
jgi:hypothetical protein